MASVFLQDGTNKSQSGPSKRGASIDCSKGRCLTHASELERLRQKEQEESNKLDKKKKRLEEREKKEREKNEAIANKSLQKEKQ